MTAILAISVALIMGLLMTRILRPLKLPDVTAYLIAGVLIWTLRSRTFEYTGNRICINQ